MFESLTNMQAFDVPSLVFYLFSALLVVSSLLVISVKNSVHSVFFLILCFFTAAALFVLLGAEYLAMLLVIVYVGAVAVLFLFVVMMLNIDFAKMRAEFLRYLPAGMLLVGLLLVEMLALISASVFGNQAKVPAQSAIPNAEEVTNAEAIGRVLYTDYIHLFQLSGIVLLIAMIGAIVLTLRTRPGVKRQKIAQQVSRRPQDCIELVDAKPGQGV